MGDGRLGRATKLGLLALLHAAVSLAVFVLTEAKTRIETEMKKLIDTPSAPRP